MTSKIHTQEISVWNEINRTQVLWTHTWGDPKKTRLASGSSS